MMALSIADFVIAQGEKDRRIRRARRSRPEPAEVHILRPATPMPAAPDSLRRSA